MPPLLILAALVGVLFMFRKNVAWVEGMRAAIARTLPSLSTVGQRIVLAQAALESDFGTKGAAIGNNPFNIDNTGWSGDTVDAPDAIPSNPKRVKTFRAYASIDVGIADYWRLLGISRYSGAREALQDGDIVSFVSILSNGGYFELDATEYLRRLQATEGKV